MFFAMKISNELKIILLLQGQEMTWVVADHEAPAGSAEITVRKGQQVEVLEVPSGQDMCLVRLHASSAAEHPVEGMVPLSVLKPPPQGLRGQRAHEGKSRKFTLPTMREL